MTPEEALAEARRRAGAARADGTYDDAAEVEALGRGVSRTPLSKLYDWAFIEPPRHVRSTRRLGWPIIAVKRLLMRLLLQYHRQLEGEETRFNVHLLAYTARLEQRIAELEREREEERRR